MELIGGVDSEMAFDFEFMNKQQLLLEPMLLIIISGRSITGRLHQPADHHAVSIVSRYENISSFLQRIPMIFVHRIDDERIERKISARLSGFTP